MISVFRTILTLLVVPLADINAAGTFYEELSEADGNIIALESTQRTPIINKSFHQCSITENCNYIIKNLSSGNFSLYKNIDDLPRNTIGLRIWKKVFHGLFNNCQHAYISGCKQNGIYNIILPSNSLSNVWCDMTTVPSGWIVFQRRVDGTVDFFRGWLEYKAGFGNLNGNFWFGLEKLHQLAAPGKGATLRVDLKHISNPNEMRYAEYSLFEIASESEGYKLTIGGYSGNAGDALLYQNNMKFSTKDNDMDAHSGNCAVAYKGAFWYNSCYKAHLNGIYPSDMNPDTKYISWQMMTGRYGGVVFSEMKTRV